VRNSGKIFPDNRDKSSALTAIYLVALVAIGIIACSSKTSDETQAAAQPAVIQGDPIDSPAAVSTPPNETQNAQTPGEMPAQSLRAATTKEAGPNPVERNLAAMASPRAAQVPSTASKTAPSPSTQPEENSSPAEKPGEEAPEAESSPASAPAVVTPAPEAASASPTPGSSNNSGYQRITLGLLGSFRYEYPDPTYLESEEDPSKLKLKDQFPPNIKALHGKKISIMGYIMPIDVDEEWRVKTFTLVRDQMVCCFGNVPEINEWVYVRLKTPQRADQLIDVPVIVFGTLEVGEEISSGALANVYRVEADRVSTNY
jgi:hypothetical protein